MEHATPAASVPTREEHQVETVLLGKLVLVELLTLNFMINLLFSLSKAPFLSFLFFPNYVAWNINGP
jgi:hypothetical protein